MATDTQHLGLIKPSLGENYDVNIVNLNSDIIDSAVNTANTTANIASSNASLALTATVTNTTAIATLQEDLTTAQSDIVNVRNIAEQGISNAAAAGERAELGISNAAIVQDDVNLLTENVLQKDNSIPFTPTENYHPSTKKYVDEAAGTTPGPQGPQGETGPQGEQGPQGEGADLSFVYKCTGTADSTAIANIVNDFFNNGTAMAMKLIISGTMGVAFTGNYAMSITATNTRGAVCYLDFSDCHIPEITTADKDFLYINSSTVNLSATGLVATTTRYGINLTLIDNCAFSNGKITSSDSSGAYLASSGNHSFSNFHIIGKTYGVNIASTFSGICVFSNACKIMGSPYGIYASTTNTAAIVKLIGCSIRGSGSSSDVYQYAASTTTWHITGCSFAYSSIYLGASKSVSTATANEYIYMPAYANQFSRTIT